MGYENRDNDAAYKWYGPGEDSGEIPVDQQDQNDNDAKIGAVNQPSDPSKDAQYQEFLRLKGLADRKSISLTTIAEATADINASWMEQFGTNAPKAIATAYYNELSRLQSGRVSGGTGKDGKIIINTQGVSASEIKAMQNRYLTAAASDLIAAAGNGDVKAVAALQKGNFGLTYTTLKNAYAENGLPVNVQALGKLTVESSMNPVILKSNLNLINMQAKTYFPALADKIDKGYTVKQLLTPYINTRANILEEDPDSVDVSSLKSIASDPKGLMGLYDYEISLRKDPKWRFTKNAQDSLGSLARDLTKMFGLAG
jgi:hypothetical protein